MRVHTTAAQRLKSLNVTLAKESGLALTVLATGCTVRDTAIVGLRSPASYCMHTDVALVCAVHT